MKSVTLRRPALRGYAPQVREPHRASPTFELPQKT